MSWNLTGTYFESCNCEVACPCVFLSNPTEDQCDALVAWHIDSGSFDDVRLDGLNVAFAVRSPGNMAQVKWDAAVYLDARASQEQMDALTKIFAGQAGGHPRSSPRMLARSWAWPACRCSTPARASGAV